jgi:hypothetical protein
MLSASSTERHATFFLEPLIIIFVPLSLSHNQIPSGDSNPQDWSNITDAHEIDYHRNQLGKDNSGLFASH